MLHKLLYEHLLYCVIHNLLAWMTCAVRHATVKLALEHEAVVLVTTARQKEGCTPPLSAGQQPVYLKTVNLCS